MRKDIGSSVTHNRVLESGIAAGIVGGFLLLGALLFCIFFKKPDTDRNASYPQAPEETPWESKNRVSGNINDVQA